MNCDNNTAVVTWSASQGAVQYSVRAHSSRSNASCQTSDLTCNLDNITCGSRYTVQVVAMDDNCSSIPSQALVFNSGEFYSLETLNMSISNLKLSNEIIFLFLAACPPQNLSAQVNCLSNDVMISWDATRESDYFLVSVTADNGKSSESCNTTNTACSISNLTCGDTFSVQVTSVRGDCRSQHSHTRAILTGMKTVKSPPSLHPSIQSPI